MSTQCAISRPTVNTDLALLPTDPGCPGGAPADRGTEKGSTVAENPGCPGESDSAAGRGKWQRSADETNALIDRWTDPTRSLSAHIRLTISEAVQRRELGVPPLAEGEPIPGCTCATCETFALGGTAADASEAEEAVHWLALVPPGERVSTALGWQVDREAFGRPRVLPTPKVLARMTAAVPGALRDAPTSGEQRQRAPLEVETARAVPIVEVAEKLGVGTPKRVGKEHVCLCPLHEDRTPSLRLDSAQGLWYCDPCGEGGDGIRLVERAHGCSFAEAVRELIGK